MAEIILTEENFEKEILQSDKPVLVDFWAPWCGPCKMLGPVIEELAQELSGRAKVAKVNVDEQAKLAAEYGIVSIPTLIVFKNGKVTNKSVGVQAKDDIEAMLL